jgi:hypothetical protein
MAQARSPVVGPVAVIGGLALAFFGYELLLAKLDIAPALLDGELTEAQEKSIDVMLDLCETLIGWSIAAVGAVGVLVMSAIEKNLVLQRRDTRILLCIVGFGVSSLFFGHLAFDLTKRLLAVQQFPIPNESLHWSLRLQYFCALVTFGTFGVFATSLMDRLVEKKK